MLLASLHWKSKWYKLRQFNLRISEMPNKTSIACVVKKAASVLLKLFINSNESNKYEKTRTSRQHSLHGENSTLAFIGVVHQLFWKLVSLHESINKRTKMIFIIGTLICVTPKMAIYVGCGTKQALVRKRLIF